MLGSVAMGGSASDSSSEAVGVIMGSGCGVVVASGRWGVCGAAAVRCGGGVLLALASVTGGMASDGPRCSVPLVTACRDHAIRRVVAVSDGGCGSSSEGGEGSMSTVGRIVSGWGMFGASAGR